MASVTPTTRVKLVDTEMRGDSCSISPATCAPTSHRRVAAFLELTAAAPRSVAAVTNAAYGVAILTDAARTFKARVVARKRIVPSRRC